MVIALFAFALVAVGCGDDSDGDASAITDDGSDSDDTASDDDGSGSDDDDTASDDGATSGEATDLGDFPIPAPPGGTVEFDLDANVRIVSYPLSDLDAIVSFYEDWIAAGDWSPPEGIQSSVFVIEETGQISGTAYVSANELYSIVGTPDGDRIDLSLSVQG